MRRSLLLLLPAFIGASVFTLTADARHAPPFVTVADVTTVARPMRARWLHRLDRPIRVYISRSPGDAEREAFLASDAWDGFGRWSASGIPVRFSRATSPARADVIVEWVDRLPGSTIGKTWRRDVGEEIDAARVTLALHDHRGRILTRAMQRGALLHEIGHLLGLEHVGQRDSIMYPQVWVTDISERDRAALRDLYRPNRHAAD